MLTPEPFGYSADKHSDSQPFCSRTPSRGVNVPSSTVSDYCKRFEITPYDIDTFLAKDEDVIYEILFPEKNLPRLSKERPLPDVEYIHKEIAKKVSSFLGSFQFIYFKYLELEYSNQF